jgi:methyl-accepting chemotaxis protein
MNIKQSIIGGVGAFIAIIALNSYIGLSASQKLGQLLDYISGPAWNAADGAMEGQIGLEAQIILLQQLYHKELSLEQTKTDWNEAVSMENDALGRMKGSGLMSKQTIAQLDTQLDNFHKTRSELLHKIGNEQDAAPEYNRLAQQLDELLEFIARMEEEADSKVESEIGNVQKLQTSAQSKMMIALIASALLSAAIFIIANHTILQPIARITSNLRELASGSGDLTARLENADRASEMGLLATSFNTFVEKLQAIIIRAQNCNHSITAASTQIMQSSSQTARGAEEQVQDITHVSNAVDVISQTLSRVVNAAEKASTVSTEAATTTDIGNSVVASAQAGVDDVTLEVDKASNALADLLADSRNIGSMLEAIRSIAEQTNLLALNAAIEAARAGESGRGFAVVADEVRNLASSTQQSTKAIEGIISNLTSASTKAVQAMESVQKKAVNIKERITHTSHAFSGIVTVIDQIKDMNSEIAAASEEETEGMNQITLSMNRILKQAEKNREISAQMRMSGKSLASDISQLDSLLREFRT